MSTSTALHALITQHLVLAEHYRYLARYSDALQVLETATKLGRLGDASPADANQIVIKTADLTIEYNWLHNHVNQSLDDLQTTLMSALAHAKDRGDTAQIALALLVLGRLHYFHLFEADTAGPDVAESFLTQAYSHYLEIADPHGQAEALFYHGLIYQIHKPDAARAMTLFQQAKTIIEGRDESVLLSYIVRHMGYAHQLAGDLDAARDHLAQSLALRESAGFRVFLPMAHIALADVLALQGQMEQAVSHYQTALAITAEVEPDNRRIFVLMGFAELYEKFDPAQAQTYYEQARDGAENIKAAHLLPQINEKLAVLQLEV